MYGIEISFSKKKIARIYAGSLIPKVKPQTSARYQSLSTWLRFLSLGPILSHAAIAFVSTAGYNS